MNPDQQPLVSVIMPTFNRAHLLPKATESILSQSYQNLEIIIFDDASTDATESLIEAYASKDKRIVYIKHPTNIGITASRNKALTHAHGELIAMLDSDDYWIDTNKIKKQVEFMTDVTNNEVGLLGTQMQVVDPNKKVLFTSSYALTDRGIRNKFMYITQFSQSTVMVRKAMLEPCNKYGDVYDPLVPIWEDYDLWMRIGTKHKLANLPDITTHYLSHDSNISTKDKKKWLDAISFIINRYKHDYPFYILGKAKLLFRRTLFTLQNFK